MPRVRVHELAAELNVPAQDVLDFLHEVKVKVRDRSTVLSEATQARIRGRFDRSARRPRPKAQHSRPSPVDPTGHDIPVEADRVVEPVAAPARLDPSILFLAPSAAAPPLTPAAPKPALPRPAAPPPIRRATPVAAPAARVSPAVAEHHVRRRQGNDPFGNQPSAAIPAQRRAVEPPDEAALLADWDRREFSAQERIQWLDSGLSLAESSLADQCRIAGIDPAELGLKLSGRTTLQRLRGGEAATSVWARIAEGEQLRRGSKLSGRFSLS